MDVSDAEVLREAGKAADLDVLADDHDLLGDHLADGQLGAGVLAVLQGLDVCGSVRSDDLGDILDEIDEQRGLGSEVGLGIDLDDDADAVLDGGVSHALGSDAAGLLGGLRQALFTQPLNGLVHIAVILGQCLLAVHHADVGHFTQFLDISSSKCHGYILLYLLFRKNARRTRRASGFQ